MLKVPLFNCHILNLKNPISYFFRAKVKRYKTMIKILNVAEKNDAAKSIAEIMSNGGYNRREGYSKFNKIYEYNYRIFNQNCTMIMTSVSGHVLNLEFMGSYTSWKACNPVSLFDAPVTFYCPKDFLGIKKTLEREARSCSILILWTDGDREGENIAFEIIDICKNINSHIQIYRAKFSEITPHAIRRACLNLIQPDKRISDAVNVRRELDLRIGAAFTRFQTLRLQKKFPDYLSNQLISYGSCQFPTLGFVVERYKQIESFLIEPFWKIVVEHQIDKDTHATFSWKRGRLFDHGICYVLYKRMFDNPLAKVISVESKKKSKWRPLPMDTVEFEKLASRKLKITAKSAMTIAEKLYTKGIISYPRTETNIFPKELDLNNLVQLQTEDPNWGHFAQGILQHGANPRQGKKTDNAHPPIHPTRYAGDLQANEGRVYELIVRHFLACVSKDAEGMQTTVNILINEEEFIAKGLIILERNYLEVYPYEKWSDKNLPEYQLGQTFTPTKIMMIESETSPPSLLTEADLIALMEKHGIGTDATHAEHIETIKARLYIGLTEDSKFVPGQLGLGLVEGYDVMGFEMSKPHLRAELEADLKKICEGTKLPNVVLSEQIKKYKEVFIKASEQARKLDECLSKYFGTPEQIQPSEISENPNTSHQPITKCPKCGTGDIMIRTKKDSRKFYLGCMSYPNCTAAVWLPDHVEEVSVEDETCTDCANSPHKLKFKVKRGSLTPYYPDTFVGCLGGCDTLLLQAWNIPSLKNLGKLSSSSRGSSISSTTRATTNTHFSSRSNTSSYRQPNFRKGSETNTPRSTTSAHSSRPHSNSSSLGTSPRPSGDSPQCLCQKTAILLTVKKDGPNKGRMFYKCAQPQSSQCNFFKWLDEVTSGTSMNSISFTNAGRSDSGPDAKKKRKCGQCGVEGHNRKNCPSR